MNNKALTLSVLMAIIAVFFVSSYVTSIEDEAKKKFGTEVLVVKAKKDIKEMETINETMLEVAHIPKRFLEPAAVYFENKKDDDKDVLKSVKSLIGEIAMVPIKKNEQVTFNKLTDPGMRTGVSNQVTPGHRAVSIPVSEITSVSKLVKPGDRVDIIAIIDTGVGKTNRIVKTIFQDIVVLSVGRNVTGNVARLVETDSFGGQRVRNLTEDSTFSSVTLEVDPLQAQTLTLLASGGDNILSLSLRNNDDSEHVNLSSQMVLDVLGPDASRIQRTPAQR